jgi:hypothetical protein
MAAYGVSARLQPGRPHLATTPEVPKWIVYGEVHVDDRLVDMTPPGQRELELRWEAICERWSQLTFFLFDPDSWRS